MKKLLYLSAFLFSSIFAISQQSDYKVVFDLTSKDSMAHKSVMRWMNEVIKSNPDAKLEVVMYGQGLFMVTADKTTVGNEVAKLAANKNISFKVCEIAMKNQKVEKSQLIPGVQIVSDGIYEILTRQREGWGYIKATIQ